MTSVPSSVSNFIRCLGLDCGADLGAGLAPSADLDPSRVILAEI